MLLLPTRWQNSRFGVAGKRNCNAHILSIEGIWGHCILPFASQYGVRCMSFWLLTFYCPLVRTGFSTQVTVCDLSSALFLQPEDAARSESGREGRESRCHLAHEFGYRCNPVYLFSWSTQKMCRSHGIRMLIKCTGQKR